jgi:hypothetical protein
MKGRERARGGQITGGGEMIQLDLTGEEVRILAEILESSHSDLRMEIADTDSMDFRNMLKQRKAVVAKALEALGHPVISAGPDIL